MSPTHMTCPLRRARASRPWPVERADLQDIDGLLYWRPTVTTHAIQADGATSAQVGATDVSPEQIKALTDFMDELL